MLFNSYLFIGVFLPLALVGFHLAARNGAQSAKVWLIIASFAFYSYWSSIYLLLLIGSIAVNYRLGLSLTRAMSGQSRWLLGLGITCNLGLLGAFKYVDFAVRTMNELTESAYIEPGILLPLAISFFTFQQIAYLCDVRRGLKTSGDILDYVLFVSFFPQLIAGPIVKYDETVPQFRRFVAGLKTSGLAIGIAYFALGLFKKTVLGDAMGVYADSAFSFAGGGHALTIFEAWLGAIAFALQIYFDFSGYCDMAIGLGYMFGVRLPLNFNSPYKASSIIDFWQRWHMTLSRFLRDHLYIPLGGNRVGFGSQVRNIMIVMLLGGLWHGAGWTFVVWGGLHGILIVINHAWRRVRKGQAGAVERILGRIVTLLCVVLAWVFFRAESFTAALDMLTIMLGFDGIPLPASFAAALPQAAQILANIGFGFGGMFSGGILAPNPLGAILTIMGTAAIALFLPNAQEIFIRYRPYLENCDMCTRQIHKAFTWRISPAAAVATGITLTLALMAISRAKVFLYFQF